MHSALYRVNALSTYAFTVLAAMALGCTLTGAPCVCTGCASPLSGSYTVDCCASSAAAAPCSRDWWNQPQALELLWGVAVECNTRVDARTPILHAYRYRADVRRR
jgi:hypothetical protein